MPIPLFHGVSISFHFSKGLYLSSSENMIVISPSFQIAMFALAATGISAPNKTIIQFLRRQYGTHKVKSYRNARQDMYGRADCLSDSNQLELAYTDARYNWKCGTTKIPDSKSINAEHTIPQSSFNKKTPEVSDLHHLFSAPAKLNNRRSNYKFDEFPYSQCKSWCYGFECDLSEPEDKDKYACLSYSNTWMPPLDDRGRVARAAMYFITMYDTVDVNSKVLSYDLMKKWHKEHPPSDFEKSRNKIVNQTQGNLNPYILDPSWADRAFP